MCCGTPTTTLQRDAQWSGSARQRCWLLPDCDRHPDLAHLWRTGQVNNDVVAVLARGLHGVTATVEHQVVTALLPQLPHLSVAAMRIVVSRLLDLLRPRHATTPSSPTTTAATCQPPTTAA